MKVILGFVAAAVVLFLLLQAMPLKETVVERERVVLEDRHYPRYSYGYPTFASNRYSTFPRRRSHKRRH